jgi:hypothetical protein
VGSTSPVTSVLATMTDTKSAFGAKTQRNRKIATRIAKKIQKKTPKKTLTMTRTVSRVPAPQDNKSSPVKSERLLRRPRKMRL